MEIPTYQSNNNLFSIEGNTVYIKRGQIWIESIVHPLIYKAIKFHLSKNVIYMLTSEHLLYRYDDDFVMIDYCIDFGIKNGNLIYLNNDKQEIRL